MNTSIGELPEDLVLKILSFLSIKHVVVTSLLSKRWRSLWTRVPRLKYDVWDLKNRATFERLIKKSLLAHRSHVLEALCFELNASQWNKDIGSWIRTALRHHHCHLRELEIDVGMVRTLLPLELFTCKTLVVLKLKGSVIDVVKPLTTVSLPSLKTVHINHSSDSGLLQLLLSSCNITDLVVTRKLGFLSVEFDVSWCKTLVALKLEGLKDVITSISSSAVSLPFLKTLHVTSMLSFNNETFSRLLSNCPVLSNLILEEVTSDVLLNLDTAMPFLKRVSIVKKLEGSSTHLCSFMDNFIQKVAPSCKYFKVQEKYLSYIRSYVNVRFRDASKLEDVSIFHQIVHLELSICGERSGEMLVELLLRSTKLVVLKLYNVYELAPLDHWDPPSSVPECLLSSLETLEWRRYTGRDGDRDLMSYLLNHAICLKTAKIFSVPYSYDKQWILKDLASMPRVSKSCELVSN